MFFQRIRNIILVILAIGLPIFIYLGFFAREPIFEAEYDVQLGYQTVTSIGQDPEEYPILSRDSFPEVYAYLQEMVNDLVSSPEIEYRDLYKYDSVQVINRDDVLNAFCTPGGYIYVYTGLIKYLDAKDYLAGVLGHEMAHAEKRHSAKSLQREFGRDKILDFIIIGTPITVGGAVNASILNRLMNLSYTREQEAEADKYSVHYLSTSRFACNGTGAFFKKLLEEGDNVNIPEFLSDHPGSESRIREIDKEAKKLGCSIELGDQSDWRAFQQLLPQNEEESEEPVEEEEEGAEATAEGSASGEEN